MINEELHLEYEYNLEALENIRRKKEKCISMIKNYENSIGNARNEEAKKNIEEHIRQLHVELYKWIKLENFAKTNLANLSLYLERDEKHEKV
ncbi:hypothetical protein XO10_00570 [Marinitoga sp. 1135]|uniref:hypothetical protein n=1 Tax=unclassified Marinitoga TaxID=2640159 RepID=UPI001585D817|nr:MULTISPECIES: hypothetical protein [unclassified Marinitoga]NUU94813.1 hypothetical protein [Marinitoga sp. 1135]NUU96741.1 hypothetical protein [Marinitoga sp. 1138]